MGKNLQGVKREAYEVSVLASWSSLLHASIHYFHCYCSWPFQQFEEWQFRDRPKDGRKARYPMSHLPFRHLINLYNHSWIATFRQIYIPGEYNLQKWKSSHQKGDFSLSLFRFFVASREYKDIISYHQVFLYPTYLPVGKSKAGQVTAGQADEENRAVVLNSYSIYCLENQD